MVKTFKNLLLQNQTSYDLETWPVTLGTLKPLGQCRIEPPCEVGEKVYIIGASHMTKMAVMLIYVKNLQNSNRPRYQMSVYRTIGPRVVYRN